MALSSYVHVAKTVLSTCYVFLVRITNILGLSALDSLYDLYVLYLQTICLCEPITLKTRSFHRDDCSLLHYYSNDAHDTSDFRIKRSLSIIVDLDHGLSCCQLSH